MGDPVLCPWCWINSAENTLLNVGWCLGEMNVLRLLRISPLKLSMHLYMKYEAEIWYTCSSWLPQNKRLKNRKQLLMRQPWGSMALVYPDQEVISPLSSTSLEMLGFKISTCQERVLPLGFCPSPSIGISFMCAHLGSSRAGYKCG